MGLIGPIETPIIRIEYVTRATSQIRITHTIPLLAAYGRLVIGNRMVRNSS